MEKTSARRDLGPEVTEMIADMWLLSSRLAGQRKVLNAAREEAPGGLNQDQFLTPEFFLTLEQSS